MIEHCWILRGRGIAVSKSEMSHSFEHEYTTQYVVVQNEIARVTWASDNVIGDVVVTRVGDVCCDGWTDGDLGDKNARALLAERM